MPKYVVTTNDRDPYAHYHVELGDAVVASCQREGDAHLIAKLLNDHAASVKLNGWPVIYSKPLDDKGRLVCVQRDHPFHPYVVAVHVEGQDEWLWGDYCKDKEEADATFERRFARYHK